MLRVFLVAKTRLDLLSLGRKQVWTYSVLGDQIYEMRPSLSKNLFPVGRVGEKTASREVGNFFSFPNFNFHKLEYTVGGSILKKKKKMKNEK